MPDLRPGWAKKKGREEPRPHTTVWCGRSRRRRGARDRHPRASPQGFRTPASWRRLKAFVQRVRNGPEVPPCLQPRRSHSHEELGAIPTSASRGIKLFFRLRTKPLRPSATSGGCPCVSLAEVPLKPPLPVWSVLDLTVAQHGKIFFTSPILMTCRRPTPARAV